MFSITDLPRNEGVIERDFLAKHTSSSFTLEGYGFHFVGGVTTDAVRGLVPDRLCAAYGSDITFVPCDRESGLAALAWMERHTVPAQRVERLSNELSKLFPEAKPLVVERSVDREPALEPPKVSEPKHSTNPPPMPGHVEFDTDHETPTAKKRGK